jgi:hypothetical protein
MKPISVPSPELAGHQTTEKGKRHCADDDQYVGDLPPRRRRDGVVNEYDRLLSQTCLAVIVDACNGLERLIEMNTRRSELTFASCKNSHRVSPFFR